MQVEKNDVDLSKLFYFGKEFSIKGKNGKALLTAYIRLVGDAELNRARTFAIRRSAELRARLKSSDTDESIAYIPSKEVAEKDLLVSTILTISYQSYTREALREAQLPPIPVEPSSDASLERQEEYQKEIDSYQFRRNTVISEYVEAKLSAERERVLKLSDSDIYDYYKKLVIADICEQEMYKIFREQCAYYGSYKDKNYTTPLFTSYAQFENLPPEVKEQFLVNYASVDISSEDLKK